MPLSLSWSSRRCAEEPFEARMWRSSVDLGRLRHGGHVLASLYPTEGTRMKPMAKMANETMAVGKISFLFRKRTPVRL